MMKLPQNEKRNKEKDLLSHPTVFASRYFVSNCAKRVNVTRSGLALPLAVRLICIHTWKSGLQQGSPAPSFLSLFPSCILARKSALVKKKTQKNNNPTPCKPRADHSSPCTCFLWQVVFFLKGCFEKQEGFVLGPTELRHRLPHWVRGALLPEEELVLPEPWVSQRT